MPLPKPGRFSDAEGVGGTEGVKRPPRAPLQSLSSEAAADTLLPDDTSLKDPPGLPLIGGLPLPRAGEAGADGANLEPRASPQSLPESIDGGGPRSDRGPPPPRPGISGNGPDRVQSPADRPSAPALAVG